ncbi:MAG: hypothetical protein LBV04_06820 [Deferribacteraceae bacterium]|nr:hypothetical protein [Deferribacteraceae bacterium]
MGFKSRVSYDKIIAATGGNNLLVPTGSVFLHGVADSSIPEFESPTEEEYKIFLKSSFGVDSFEEWMQAE